MLTPQDVRAVQFEKNLRGYRTEDVDRFLDKVEQQLEQDAGQMEALRKQVADLTAENETLRRSMQSYEADGDMLKSALINAQRMGENVIREANDKKLAEEREYDRVRLEVTRFKSDVLNLYRTHVESLSRLPEFQQKEEAAAQDAGEELPEAEAADAENAETAPAADAPEAEAAPAVPASDKGEDFWEKDESQLKLDPPPADPNAAFQGVSFSE